MKKGGDDRNMNGKSALGAILVIIGGLIVLDFIGISLGSIIGFLFPFILIGLGILGWVNNSKIVGAVLTVVGVIMLFGKFAGFFMLLLAIGMIVWGISLFRNKRVF
ncbi:hypothetical protein ABEV74_21625 [Paenibacillus cisolokensis]|jgi:hypothetical protein|uniref:LiaF transmembrane domain-containing protein n=1 Tax=Paenibacillus cisolokensis TaxID=1658519 RepID=A0ABQ4N5I1_9BACL|nr:MULTISPECIES: hypothetical protein [Paenibacillus]ALS29583.1 hypothetical protein IJ21_41990 [Paenibacillus sp. 32O-W]GIQ63419.1 hypothetical protein PACILC2_19870 [Paenibacillus cisolokensis]